MSTNVNATSGESLVDKRRRLDVLLSEAGLLIKENADLEISSIHIDRNGVATFRIIPGVDLP